MPSDRFDAYTMKARVYPALLVLLPLFLSTLAWAPTAQKGLGSVVSIVVTCGAAYLLSELGRDPGRNREARLFALWGGKPTTLALRHRGNPNPVLRARQHQQIRAV